VRQLTASIIQVVEAFFVQQLVAQAAVERLDEGILLRLTWIDVIPLDLVPIRPF
jgi:hypothetical protein